MTIFSRKRVVYCIVVSMFFFSISAPVTVSGTVMDRPGALGREPTLRDGIGVN